MLSLCRRRNQAVTITDPDGNTCRVHVVRVEGGRVVLAFDCPRDWLILRDEVKDCGARPVPGGRAKP